MADLPHSWVVEYYEAIEKGEIIAGEELKMMLRKLVAEIRTPNVLAVPTRFEPQDSEKRIAFIEKKCKHSEAPYAGKPFILELFQKAFIEAIFAIKIYSDELGRWVRKYSSVLFLVGRKNGKTPLIGAICLAEWFCGEMGKKILCASNDFEQAALMYDAIDAMREESPSIERVTRRNVRGMWFGNPKHKKTKGKFSYQNKGSIRKLSAKSGAKEGRNIGVGAVDEVFEMEDDKTVMPIRQALSTQDEPLYFELTTEGFTNDGYLDKRLADARRVLYGEKENERWLIWLYTQDSEEEIYKDERTWEKSNPGVGKFKKYSFLREMLEEAKTSTSMRAFVLSKDFNIKQNQAQAWLTDETIKTDLDFDISEIMGWFGIGGADLSETSDLSCARILLQDADSRMKYTISHYFLPAFRAEENAKYREWAKQGYLTLCDGNEVEQGDVVEWFVAMYKKYRIRAIFTGYDKWQAKSFVSEMDDYGFELEKINQGFDLSNAMNVCEADLQTKQLNYGQNPMDIFCMKNVSCKWNSAGTMRMPVKVKSENQAENKIDGAVTLMICYETLDRHRKDYMDYVAQYNHRRSKNGTAANTEK